MIFVISGFLYREVTFLLFDQEFVGCNSPIRNTNLHPIQSCYEFDRIGHPRKYRKIDSA